MATLIEVTSGSGRRRRCDANCYNATGQKCTCICGGANHGKGLEKALENTRKIVETFAERAEQEGLTVLRLLEEGVTNDVNGGEGA